MNTLIPIIISSIAGLSTIIGNILIFIPVKYKNQVLSFSFGLSSIVMLLISIFELIPEGLNLIKNTYQIHTIMIQSLILLLIGYYIIKIVDKKLEHQENLYRVGILSMISILIHNIPEGIICAITSSINIKIGLKVSLAILIHNIPEGICISLPIYYSTKSKLKAFIYTLISGAGEVIGAIITILFLKSYITANLLYFVYLITAGIMITLSLTKLLKQGLELHNYYSFILGIVLGIIIIIITI
ncbi:MAG TPA: hypothetical protein DCE23_06580 [Firmicutes bacterium]|nr:hypothetical protein [Bacillota bacterium]